MSAVTVNAKAKAEYGFHAVYLALGLALAVAAFAAGIAGPWKVQPKPRVVETVKAPGTGAALVAKWGNPDQSVDGAQINAGLAGTRCAVYRSRKAIVCYVP